MKHHPPILIVIPLILLAGYIGWALSNGKLYIKRRAEPIRRQDNPREYWYYLCIIIVIFAILVGLIGWMFS